MQGGRGTRTVECPVVIESCGPELARVHEYIRTSTCLKLGHRQNEHPFRSASNPRQPCWSPSFVARQFLRLSPDHTTRAITSSSLTPLDVERRARLRLRCAMIPATSGVSTENLETMKPELLSAAGLCWTIAPFREKADNSTFIDCCI